MSIYGNAILESCDQKEALLEFKMFNKNPKMPDEFKMTTEDDVRSAASFKKKSTGAIKFIQQNGNDPKQLDKVVYAYYWAIIGNTFDGQCKKYEPKMSYYLPLVKKYCNEKHINGIKKDIEKTIVSLDKMDQSKLNSLQKEYIKDLKANVSKLG